VSCGVLDGGFWARKYVTFFNLFFGQRSAVEGQQQVPFEDDKQEKQRQQQKRNAGILRSAQNDDV
jgi:hypothetical protein